MGGATNCDGCGSEHHKHLPSLCPQRTTSPQGHLSSTLVCSHTGLCPTPVSVVTLHLDILHLLIPFSMLILYLLLDLWFVITGWSQASNGNITFQWPAATWVGPPEGLYLHHVTETELRKHTLNSLIGIFVLLPTAVWGYAARLVVSALLTGLLRARICQADDVGLPILLPATASSLHFSCLLLLSSYPVWCAVSGLHPLSVGCFSSSVKCCFPCPARLYTWEKSPLRSSDWMQVLFIIKARREIKSNFHASTETDFFYSLPLTFWV